MNEDEKNLLVSPESIMSFEDMQNLILQFQDQLNTLNYQVTNKNFGSKIYQAKETIASKGRFVAGSKDDVVIMDGQNPTWRLWAGKEDPATAPFRVDKDGNMVASSVTLTGYIPSGGAAADVNSGATTISGGKITTNSIAASAIVAGSLVVGTNVGLGTAQTAGQVTTIVGNTVTTSFVNALSITAGSVAAENITGTTITGKTIVGSTLSTATSGQRTELTATTARYYDGNNVAVGLIFASAASGGFIISCVQSSSNIFIFSGSSGQVVLGTSVSAGVLIDDGHIYPGTSDVYDLGNISRKWNDIWNTGIHEYQGIDMPVVIFGAVESGSIVKDNTPGWSVTHTATGRFTVNHSIGHTNYNVQLIARAALVKNITVESFGTSSFVARIASLADALEDNDFFFLVSILP
jgi:hypothetical protein